MDFLEIAYKKSARTGVKVGKIIFKSLLRPIVRTTSQVIAAISSRPLADRHHLNLHAFMTLIIKVDSSRRGWQKGVTAVLRNCKGARVKMDENGVVEISGVGDTDRLLKKIGRSSRVRLLWLQSGQCSENLFLPSSAKKSDAPAQESRQPFGYGNNIWFPFLPSTHGGYAHSYHPTPHLITPYGPYDFDHNDHARLRPLF